MRTSFVLKLSARNIKDLVTTPLFFFSFDKPSSRLLNSDQPDFDALSLQSLHSIPWPLPLPCNAPKYKEAALHPTRTQKPMTRGLASKIDLSGHTKIQQSIIGHADGVLKIHIKIFIVGFKSPR